MGKGERPEDTAPPEVFYNEEEAAKYTSNSRIIGIQARGGGGRDGARRRRRRLGGCAAAGRGP